MGKEEKKPSIIVTGGAGYIGSHVCKALYPKYLPITIDNLSSGRKEFVQWGPLYTVDIQEEDALIEIFHKHQPKAVMHFAGFSSVVESVKNPSSYYKNNLLSTFYLLEACRKSSIQHFIFSSSCTVFGIPQRLPIQENDPKNPISPYGKSKKMVEEILQDYASSYGIHSVILRYFNAAGADQEGQLGENREYETHLIPLALKALLQEKPIYLFGNDFETSDGTAVRDYVHVTDLSEAHILALEWLLVHETSNIFHLGSGRGTSVLEVLRSIEAVTGKPLHKEICPRRKGEPASLVADIAKANHLLGWTPKRSNIDSILKSAYDWYIKIAQNHAIS